MAEQNIFPQTWWSHLLSEKLLEPVFNYMCELVRYHIFHINEMWEWSTDMKHLFSAFVHFKAVYKRLRLANWWQIDFQLRNFWVVILWMLDLPTILLSNTVTLNGLMHMTMRSVSVSCAVWPPRRYVHTWMSLKNF